MADQPTPGIWPCCMGENICEEYYGWRCIVCGTFYAFGCEPWILDDPMEDDYDDPC